MRFFARKPRTAHRSDYANALPVDGWGMACTDSIYLRMYFFFFFKDPAPPEIYPFSLHDALPIYEPESLPHERERCGAADENSREKLTVEVRVAEGGEGSRTRIEIAPLDRIAAEGLLDRVQARSEEHTSELQSQSNLVCRLLLEQK